MKEIKVSLGKRSYSIHTGYDIFPHLKEIVRKINLSGSGAIITDTTVKELWEDALQKGLGDPLPVYAITPGETSKSLKTVKDIYTQLLKWGLDRYSYLIAFGGGVVGDVTGFVAATYMRGIPYIQVPTTLMAHVDSSIGGKTAVDLPEGKNLVGCFWQPKCVFSDIKTLSTLPKVEFKTGLSEVIKYGVIKDENLFKSLEQEGENLFNLKRDFWEPIITKCAEIKADVVSQDEREVTGLRAILNYGHTLGHALETITDYKYMTHGEAVAMGMVFAAKLSHKLGYLSQIEMNRQTKLIKRLRLYSDFKHDLKDKVLESLKYDKKIKTGKLRFVLAKKIGEVLVTDKVTEDNILTVLNDL